MRFLFLLSALCCVAATTAQNRWELAPERTIVWTPNGQLPHSDNIEMAGRRVAVIVSYAVDTAGVLSLEREVIFPQMHPYLKSTDPWWAAYRSYFRHTFTDEEIEPKIYLGTTQLVPGSVRSVRIDGMLHIEHEPVRGVRLSRRCSPHPGAAQFIEEWTLYNETDTTQYLYLTAPNTARSALGEGGLFRLRSSAPDGAVRLAPKESTTLALTVEAAPDDHRFPPSDPTVIAAALDERRSFLKEMSDNLILETPDPVLDQLFHFSKIRASENLFESELGLIHSPGGGRYYVGIWANDQAEYISPFFPYLGYAPGNESADNTYRAFDRVKPADYSNIQYAFEVEKLPPPSGLDRGDAAMIAYGAAQYALATGDPSVASGHWPLIEWCLEYNHRMLNEAGVVRSQSDEMEGRIETGTANLSTSALYYGALIHAADLARSLGRSQETVERYRKRARQLRRAIESYFGAEVEGLDTYKYYAEHELLRHWITLPLVVGIDERRDATITALFDRLWTDEGGVHVEKSNPDPAVSSIFWDRGTLYALRGTFLAGATDRSLEKLQKFSEIRLLGERVPYVVEAYPEGAMAHLSAESALYCRVFTEGLFGIRPVSLGSFECRPELPTGWDRMALRHIRLFGKDFDLAVERRGGDTFVELIPNDRSATITKKLPANGAALLFSVE